MELNEWKAKKDELEADMDQSLKELKLKEQKKSI